MRLIHRLTNQIRLIHRLTNQMRLIHRLTNQMRLIHRLTNQMRTKAHFPLGEFVSANNKKVGTVPTSPIAKICFSLRFARINSPSGEWA